MSNALAVTGGVVKESNKPKISKKFKQLLSSLLEEELGEEKRDQFCEKLNISQPEEKEHLPVCKYFCTKTKGGYEIIGCSAAATKDGFCSRHDRHRDRYAALEKFFHARFLDEYDVDECMEGMEAE